MPYALTALAFVLIAGALSRIEHTLRRILNTMATKDDLDAALASLGTTLTTATTDITNAFAALEAKITAGATGPDLQAEVDQVNTAIGGLQSIDASALTANPPA